MKMLFKCLGLAVLVLVVMATTGANSTDHYNSDELEEAFKRLEKYLTDKVGKNGDSQAYLIAAKETQKKLGWSNYLSRAAKIYIHLSEFEECTTKAVDYMWYVVKGRPNAVPGHKVLFRQSGYISEIPKDFLDRLLEATMVRASNKCKSFHANWYREIEPKIDPKSKELLHNVLNEEVISKRRIGVVAESLAHKTLNDPSLREELLGMNEEQLIKFYKNYLDENFLKPCKKFLAQVRPIMENAERFDTTYRNLFNEWPQNFLADMVRFKKCKFDTDSPRSFLDWGSAGASRMVECQRDPKKCHPLMNI